MLFLLLMALAQSAPAPGSSALDRSLRRWAIVAAPEAAATGVADLLAAALAQNSAIQLIEREHMKDVLRELTISEAFAAEATGQRLKIGRLLKADAVVLLAHEQRENDTFFRLVICETRLGARLRADLIPFEREKAEALVDELARNIDEMLRRYPAGVERVLAVPDFVSKDLTHEHDLWQTQLACVLENALASVPGTAVLETQETAAVRGEMTIGGGDPAARVVPLFIEGEYRSTRTMPAAESSLSIRLRVSDGAGVLRAFEHEASSFREATAWLHQEAPVAVLQLSDVDARKRLSVQQQIELLGQRAIAFSRLGDVQRAVGLREAALLLKPDDPRLAGPLIALMCEAISARPLRRSEVLSERQVRMCAQLWRRALEIVEGLIRARALTQVELLDLHARLTDSITRFRSRNPLPGTMEYSQTPQPIRDLLREELNACAEAHAAFARDMVPLIVRLDVGEATSQSEYFQLGSGEFVRMARDRRLSPVELRYQMSENWADLALLRPRYGAPGASRSVTPEDLSHFARVLAAPDAVPAASSELLRAFSAIVDANEQDRGVSAEQFRSFLEGLNASASPLNVLYARYGMILFDRYCRTPAEAVTDEATLRALDTLRAELKDSDLLPSDNALARAIDRRRSRIAEPSNAALNRSSAEATAKSASSATSRVATPAPREPARDVAARFEPLRFRVRQRDGQLIDWAPNEESDHPGYADIGGYPVWVAHAGAADVFVNNWAVFLHREPGIADEVVLDHSAGFTCVDWDGENIWVGGTNRGVLAISPSGKVIATAKGGQGLPPHDLTLKVAAIEPGKALAVGSFGNAKRSWIAILKLREGKIDADVFHEATLTAGPDEMPHLIETEPRVAFVACCIQKTRSRFGDGRETFLVNRKDMGYLSLAVNPTERTVSVFNRTPGEHEGLPYVDHMFFFGDGDALQVHEDKLVHVSEPGCLGTDGRPWRELRREPNADFSGVFTSRGYVYIPGRSWARLAPESLQVQMVGRDATSAEDAGQGRTLFRSAILGLICCDAEGRFQRVTLSDQREPAAKLSGPCKVRVLDADSGRPIPDALVRVRVEGREESRHTTESGEVVSNVDSGSGGYVDISAYKPGYVAQRKLMRTEREWQDAAGVVTLRLPAAITIGGVVQNTAGQPIPGTRVDFEAVSDAQATRGPLLATAVFADDHGRWQKTLAPLELSRLRLFATPPGQRWSPLGLFGEKTSRALRAGEFVWTIAATNAVLGRVVDIDGKPIAGAAVRIGVVLPPYGFETHTAETSEDGSFAFPPDLRRMSSMSIVARKPGYGTEWEDFILSDSTGPEIRLDRNRALRGRVLDAQGKAIAGAEVLVGKRSGSPGVIWEGITDESGGFEWKDAPARRFQLTVTKAGFAPINELTPVSQPDYTIRMAPAAPKRVLQGSVVDAETGVPIPAFVVAKGVSTGLSSGTRFSDGKYKVRVDAPGEAKFTVSAEGYRPEVLVVPADAATDLTLDVKLHKGQGPSAILQLADGQPASGVEIYLCADDARTNVRFEDGQIKANNVPKAVTGPDGRFTFSPQLGKFRLLAACEAGVIETELLESASVPTSVVLQAWARIEGRCQIGKEGGAGEEIRWTRPEFSRDQRRMTASGATRCDEVGRFVLTRVIPGDVVVRRVVRTGPRQRAGQIHYAEESQHSALAGATITVSIEPRGRPVIGRVTLPAGLDVEIERVPLTGHLQPRFSNRPANWSSMSEAERAAWREANDTPDARAALQRAMRQIALQFEPDGSFFAADAPIGRYRLTIDANPPAGVNLGGNNRSMLDLEVTADAPGARSPFDLGGIELGLVKTKETAASGTDPRLTSPEAEARFPYLPAALAAIVVVGGAIAIRTRVRATPKR